MATTQTGHRGKDAVGADAYQREVRREHGGMLTPGRREIGTGMHHPREIGRQGNWPLLARWAQQIVQAKFVRQHRDRGQVSIGQATGEFESFTRRHQRVARGRRMQCIRFPFRQRRTVAKVSE